NSSTQPSDDEAGGVVPLSELARYVLAMDDPSTRSGIIRQYLADGYMHVQFRVRQEALDQGYEVAVKQCAILAFSGEEADWVSSVIDHEDAGVRIKTYRATRPISEMPQCFFMLQIIEPEIGD
ncbi:MAG: hypothetical protein EA353_00270, partial [Puniceicoccaceae bacterium]